jgi:hypothetical protein
VTENDPRDHKNPGKFVDDGEPGKNPGKQPDVSLPDAVIPPEADEEPGKINRRKALDPEELNRRPGGRYNPHTGLPLDPLTGRDYPISKDTMRPYDPRTNEELPGLFDPLTLQPLFAETKEVLHARFDPHTSLPIDPSTGKPVKIDAQGKVKDPLSGLTLPRVFDAKTSRVIDQQTKKPVCPSFDSLTGRPYNFETGKLFPINQNKRPYDPKSLKQFEGEFDPISGKPLNPDGTIFECAKFDENTGRPMNKNGEVVPLDSEGYPIVDGKKFPQKFSPLTGTKVNPDGSYVTLARYDKNTGLPIDQIRQESTIVHPDTGIPTNIHTGKEYTEMGRHEPCTGRYISEEGKVAPDRFDAETGRPIDQKTGELIPIDQSSCFPIDPLTKKVFPGVFDPATG